MGLALHGREFHRALRGRQAHIHPVKSSVGGAALQHLTGQGLTQTSSLADPG